MSLDANMKLAVAAAGYARLKVPNSLNYEFTSSPIERANGDLLYKATLQQMMAVRGNLPKGVGKEKTYAEMARRAIEQRAGNCHEVAIIACEFLKTKGVSPVELAFVVDSASMNEVIPHVICIIGRAGAIGQGGSVGLPNRWGGEAVVCDPWDRVNYPATMYETFWDGIKKKSDSPGTLDCVVDYAYA